ncbi:MAG: hypothetical protein IPN02_09995 [Candidatus Microthrix sp.]|uniref:ABC transporter domain-containing protein n=1 Tax=Candidatus Neomicrothrix subdominans TaxID=2954438 RepID=A0A936TEJ9_9ACTN|nr:hypothetical protein [Candidatus Microthrix subdominans]
MPDWDSSVTRQSGGERQRGGDLAPDTLDAPELLLCDEPTGKSLDSSTTAEVMDLLEELHADGQTLLVVTHEADVARHTTRSPSCGRSAEGAGSRWRDDRAQEATRRRSRRRA